MASKCERCGRKDAVEHWGRECWDCIIHYCCKRWIGTSKKKCPVHKVEVKYL